MEAEAMNGILHSLTNTAIDERKEQQFKVVTRNVLFFDFTNASLEAQIFMDLYIIRESYSTPQCVVQCIKLLDRIFNGYWNSTQWCLSSFAWSTSLYETFLDVQALEYMSFNDVNVCKELSQWLQLIPTVNTRHLLLLVSTLISSLFASVDVWVIDYFTCELIKQFAVTLNMQQIEEYNEVTTLQKILMPCDTRVKQLQEYFGGHSPLGANLKERMKSIKSEGPQPRCDVLVARLVSLAPTSVK